MIPKKPDPLASILAERKRQLEVEGYLPEHDDAHDRSELTLAAGCYFEGLDQNFVRAEGDEGDPVNDGPAGDPFDVAMAARYVPVNWPFEAAAWKPKERRRDLERAGAFLLAERDRLIRADDLSIASFETASIGKLNLEPLRGRLRAVLAAIEALNEAERAAERGDSLK